MSGRCFMAGCAKPAPFGLRRGKVVISELKGSELTAHGWPKYLHHCADHADQAQAHLAEWLREQGGRR